jgi:hypothetical protein
MGQYNDYVTKESQAPQTWNKIEEILRRNGYSDDEIEDIKSSVKCLTGAGEVTCAGTNEKFRGSVILPGILGDLGYDGSWWDVRPDEGQPCTVYAENNDPLADQTADPNNPLGEYDADGNCVPLSSERQPGQPCPTAQGEGGIISANGDCETDFTQGVKCNATVDGVLVEGKRDANGDCVPLGQGTSGGGCSVITQENADECGYEITSDGQLIPKNLDDPNLPNYTSCGGNIFVEEGTECPDVGGIGEFCDDPANVNHPDCVPKTIEELIEEYGEAAVDTAQKVYDTVKGAIKDAIDDPLGVLRDILTGGYISDNDLCNNSKGSIDPATGTSRTNGHTDCTTAGNPEETGDVCWKDCVNASVFGGIPGLPLPPGAIDVGTVRDFENTIKEAGATLEDIFSAPTGDPNDPDFIEKVKDWVIGKIEDIFGGLEDVTADKITGWIKTVLDTGLATIILTKTEGVKNSVIDKIDEIVLGVAPNPTTLINCEDYNREGGEVKSIEECGGCLYKTQVIGTDNKCRDKDVVDDFTVDCASEGRQGDRGTKQGDKVIGCGPCLSTHQEIDEKCVEWKDPGDTEDDCIALNREYIPSPAAGTDSRCGGCLDSENYQLDENGNCVPSPIICEGNQVLDSTGTGCVDPVDCIKGNVCKTEDNKDGKYGDNCDCIPDFVNPGPTPEQCEALGRYHVAAVPEQNKPSECGDCKNGSTNEDCSIDGTKCDDPDATNFGEEGECKYGTVVEKCDDPDATNFGEEGECKYGTVVEKCDDPDATNFGEEGACKYGTVVEKCDDPDATNFGEEGACKYGTVVDPCLDSAYAEANPTICGTDPECNDCTCAEYAAANSEECGTTPPPPPPSGGSGGGGGGAGGAFSPFLAGITYTPQPVPEVIQQPSGMFTGAQPTRNTQLVGDSIIQNLFKEYFV